MDKMAADIVDPLNRRICNKGGGDYIVCYGGRNNSARVYGCHASPADRQLIMSEDMLGAAYGHTHHGQRRHRVGTDASIPWPSNHPWLWARVVVGEGAQSRQLGVATWNVMCRGASRKAYSYGSPEWSPAKAEFQYQDVIIELSHRLASNQPWDVICLQEASPGQIRVSQHGERPVYQSVGDGEFTAEALTTYIRQILGSREGSSPDDFAVLPLAHLEQHPVPVSRLETTWLLARADHGRVILIRASAVNRSKWISEAQTSDRATRHSNSTQLPLYWKPLSGNGRRETIDVHITNFHPLPPGVKDRDLLRALGIPAPGDIVEAPAVLRHSMTVRAKAFIPAGTRRTSSKTKRRNRRRELRRRWSLSSNTPKWNTSS